MKNVKQVELSQIKPAGAWARFWAIVIDGLILGIPFLLILSLIYLLKPSILIDVKTITDANGVTITESLSSLFYNVILAIFSAISILYFIYLTVTRGATWGKDAYGLAVVKYKTTQYINYKSAIIRELVKAIPGISSIPVVGPIASLIIGLIDVFLVLFTKEKRTIHDRIAGTQVIKFKKSWSTRKKMAILLPIVTSFLLVLSLYSWSTLNWKNTHLTDTGRISKGPKLHLSNYASRKFSEANNTGRRSDVNEILYAVIYYMGDKGSIPTVITTSEQKISKSGADLCKFLVPSYLAGLPVDPLGLVGNISSYKIKDCNAKYSTHYTIFKDTSTNKITVRAPRAELGEKIENTLLLNFWLN